MLPLGNRIAIAAVILVIACFGAYKRGLHHGEAKIQAKWDAERAAIAQATQQAMQERIAAEEQLRRQADEQQKTYQQKIARLAAERNALLDSVRNRPARDRGSDVPGAAAAGDRAGCTGTDLYREDAGFLVGEAERADRIAEQLTACVVQYQAARDAIVAHNRGMAVSQ
jgi:hypothetical protein